MLVNVDVPKKCYSSAIGIERFLIAVLFLNSRSIINHDEARRSNMLEFIILAIELLAVSVLGR